MWDKIKLVAFDCDGVLTDSGMYFDENGNELKKFNVKDGLGMVMLLRAGYELAIVSARKTKLVEKRMQELGVQNIFLGIKNKMEFMEKFLSEKNLKWEEVSYIGDDLTDMILLKKVGLSVTVADAMPDVKAIVDYITQHNGGNGAFREFSDLLLKKTGKYNDLLKKMNFV